MTKTKFYTFDAFLDDEGKTIREAVLSGEGCLLKHLDNRVSFTIPISRYKGKYFRFIRAAEARRFVKDHPDVSFTTIEEAWKVKENKSVDRQKGS